MPDSGKDAETAGDRDWVHMRETLNALQQQVTELERRLKKYGQHAKGCNTGDPFYGLPCSCGLEAPLTSPSTIAQKEMASE